METQNKILELSKLLDKEKLEIALQMLIQLQEKPLKNYILITKSYTSSVKVGKIYELKTLYDTDFLNGEDYVIDENGEEVATISFKYQKVLCLQ